MRGQQFLLAVMCALGPALGAQDAPPGSPATLKVAATTSLPLTRSTDMVGAAKCDDSGNIYTRPANRVAVNADEYLLAPIRQVTPEGKLAAIFRIADAWAELGAGRGIFVGSDGTVYQAAIAIGGVYVVAFAKDGSLKSKTKLQTTGYLDPWHLAVFESGRFLVSGNAGKDVRTPYTAVFEADGKLLKRIYELEDEDARRKADIGDLEFIHNDGRGNNFVDRGDVAVASDGNAYLLHGTSPALVYVISSAGEVIRKFRIAAGDSGLAFRSIESHAGQLAIGLARFGHIEVHVTSLEGNPIRSYALDGNEADVLSLACYDSRGFTFITAAARTGAYLLTAKP